MTATVAAALAWGSLALLAWSYLAYPALLLLATRGRTRAVPAAPRAGEADLPTVEVIIAAYNEERDIVQRIENLLAQDYPPGRLAIRVGSDGSRDRTVELASRLAGPRLAVHAFEANRGKASVLNDLVAASRADVLVFTDANTHFEPGTVRELVGALEGGTALACGELILRKAAEGSNEDHRYWSVERRLKLAESSIGGLLGANGGVYAMRRERYRPIRPDTICDDFVIAMNVAVAGGTLRYVPTAVAHEETPDDVAAEFHRRARIGTGNYQSLFRHPDFLLGGTWTLRFTYVSHKVLRWLTPHLLLVAFLASLVLWHEPLHRFLAVAMAAGAAGALLVFLTRDRLPWPGVLRGLSFFGLLNLAFLVGFARFATGNYRGSWRRTAR